MGRDDREPAVEYLKAAYREGRLDQLVVGGRVVRAGRACTGGGANTPPDGTRPHTPEGWTAAARMARVRVRVGDWLYRALRRAVFCWLPPGHG
ncbi:hypothetical protein BJP39_01505 [Streptomyces sp. CC77]|nr:hypothetical protein BJP39_01505 [Streptomyces sp. CC77]